MGSCGVEGNHEEARVDTVGKGIPPASKKPNTVPLMATFPATSFSKQRSSVLCRAAIGAVWRNDLKDRSENRRVRPPARALGIVKRALWLEQLLAKRLFPERRVSIPGWIS